jgi:nucleotidyltransferase/DNA polymerase involved in DNA repair
MTADRRIIHLDTHNLYVAVEQLKNRNLYGQPLVIAGQGSVA